MTVQQKYNNDFHPQRFAESVMRTEFPSLHCVSNGLHALWLFFIRSLRGSIFGSGSQRIIGFNWNISLMRNPLSPEAAARAIVAAGGVRPMKLFNYDATSIAALQSAGITHVSVSVPNVNLPQLNASTSFAAGVCQVWDALRLLWRLVAPLA